MYTYLKVTSSWFQWGLHSTWFQCGLGLQCGLWVAIHNLEQTSAISDLTDSQGTIHSFLHPNPKTCWVFIYSILYPALLPRNSRQGAWLFLSLLVFLQQPCEIKTSTSLTLHHTGHLSHKEFRIAVVFINVCGTLWYLQGCSQRL